MFSGYQCYSECNNHWHFIDEAESLCGWRWMRAEGKIGIFLHVCVCVFNFTGPFLHIRHFSKCILIIVILETRIQSEAILWFSIKCNISFHSFVYKSQFSFSLSLQYLHHKVHTPEYCKRVHDSQQFSLSAIIAKTRADELQRSQNGCLG